MVPQKAVSCKLSPISDSLHINFCNSWDISPASPNELRLLAAGRPCTSATCSKHRHYVQPTGQLPRSMVGRWAGKATKCESIDMYDCMRFKRYTVQSWIELQRNNFWFVQLWNSTPGWCGQWHPYRGHPPSAAPPVATGVITRCSTFFHCKSANHQPTTGFWKQQSQAYMGLNIIFNRQKAHEKKT